MDLLNAVVIYFALGVPFGVLSVYLRSSRLAAFDVVYVIYHLILWPFIVLSRVFGRLRWFVSDQRAELSRTGSEAIEIASASNLDPSLRRRILSQGAVLNGLKTAHQEAKDTVQLRLPFGDCIDHPSPILAAKCIQRRNIARLEKLISEAERVLSEACSLARPDNQSLQATGEESSTRETVRDLC